VRVGGRLGREREEQRPSRPIVQFTPHPTRLTSDPRCHPGRLCYAPCPTTSRSG
jgi:hypothetical protein